MLENVNLVMQIRGNRQQHHIYVTETLETANTKTKSDRVDSIKMTLNANLFGTIVECLTLEHH